MPDDTYTLDPVVVWTLPAVGASGHLLTANAASFPWGWGWTKEPLLSAAGNRFTKRPGAMGTATFTVLRDQRQEPNDSKIRAYNSPLVAGQYVCITADSDSPTADQLDPALILWWGWISSISYSQLQGTLDGVGTATALEVGHLLDQQQVVNWLEASADGLGGEPVTAPPTANLGDSSSYIVGNATAGVGIGSGGDIGYAFTRLPDDCGNADGDLWTRWRLLRHLLYGCWPGGLPVPTLACADGSEGSAGPQDNDPTGGIAGFLNDTDTPEVYDLRNLTLKGALDLCVPRSRGFNWTLELIDTKGWQVVVYSYATLGGSGGLPVNGTNDFFQYISPGNGTDLTADDFTTDVKVVSDSGTMPDEVVVEGSPIIIGNTVGFPDQNLTIGWQRGTGHQEDSFRLGASTAPDYASLTPDEQLERNASVRTGAGLRDVYTRYGLYAYDGNDDIKVSGTPGPGFGGSQFFLCPELEWDGATLKISPTVSRCPYLPASTLARTLPWPDGVKGDGTDLRPVANRYLPTFLKPKVLSYDPTAPLPWIDFEAQNGRSGYPSMSLDVDDRGMAFRVTLSSPIYLAYRHWTDAAGGTTSPADADIDPDVDPMSIDYTTLVATVGVESDQRVRVSVKRPGVTSDAQIRRRLVLREPSLQCWLMRFGSIIGLLPDGTPERVTSGGGGFDTITCANGDAAVAIRNDFPAAQKRCDMAAAWAFRERNSVIVQRAAPDSPPEYARIGYLMTSLIEKAADRLSPGASLVVNTVVEEVTYDFSRQPRISIATTMPEMIGFAAIGGGGSVGGGAVSASLGGTVGQAVLTQQQTTSGLGRDTQRVSVIQPQFFPNTDLSPYSEVVFLANMPAVVSVGMRVMRDRAHDGRIYVAVITLPLTGQFGIVTDINTTLGICTVALSGHFKMSQALAAVYPYNTVLDTGMYYLRASGVTTKPSDVAADKIGLRPAFEVNQSGDLWVYGCGMVGQSSTTDLFDVNAPTPSDQDVLAYDLASAKWKNVASPAGGSHAAASVLGRSAATSGALADIAASSSNQALLCISGTLQFAAVPNAALANSSIGVTAGAGLTGGGTASLGGSVALSVPNNGIIPAMLAQSAAWTVIGNPTNANANNTGVTATTNGQILQLVGTSLNFATPALSTNKTFITGSGTFTVPAGVYLLFYIARGGGGGGAGASGSSVSGVTFAGGGGGQGALEFGFMAVTPATVLTIAIGAGGTGGTASASGTAGGSTTITGGAFTVTAAGGGGATASSTTSNGAGGAGGSATQGVSGQNGTIPNLTGASSSAGNVTGLTFSGSYPGGVPGALGSGGGGGSIGANGNAGFVQFFY